MHANRDEIEPFVRGVLGCGCPDEVFQRMELATGQADPGGLVFTRLVIGGRLLIHVVAWLDADEARLPVETLARLGLADRDRAGCHRFRLVLASAKEGPVPAAIPDAFRAVVGRDDRAHLHWLPASSVPSVLLPGLSGPPEAAGT